MLTILSVGRQNGTELEYTMHVLYVMNVACGKYTSMKHISFVYQTQFKMSGMFVFCSLSCSTIIFPVL